MVNISEVYESKSQYLKATDLQGTVQKVTITAADVETIGTDRKIVLTFAGKSKKMVTNATNARTIGQAFGEDTDDWIGKTIEIFEMMVEFQGKMVPGLRLRIPRQAPAKAAVAPNARDRAVADMQAAPPVGLYAGIMGSNPVMATQPVASYEDALDDEVPF